MTAENPGRSRRTLVGID
ncbi:transposase, partial [Mycobacterium tuberculosis M1787]